MDVLVIAVFGAIVMAVSCVYDAYWQLPLPGLGVFDYSDVTVLAIVVMLYPFVAVVEPPWLAAVIAGAVIVNAAADLTAPVLKNRALHRFSLVFIVTAIVLLVTSHTGPIPRWALTDLLLVVVVVAVAVAWAQLGATPAHLAALAAFLTVYDIIATTLTGFMTTLMGTLSHQPIGFLFTFPAGGTACLGVGDVLVLALVPVTVRRRLDPRAALSAAAVMYGAYLAGIAISIFNPACTIPLMITLGPATLTVCGYTTFQPRRAQLREVDMLDATACSMKPSALQRVPYRASNLTA
ncbi:hypothetical protein [Mycobacterium sp. OAE908]|uniref:hypothetical protein n=1 Tax=Mycobacterium sp. OAE908 TaxID=2817899 RepID=UPI001AE204B7